MTIRVLQCNLNHSIAAQDLMRHNFCDMQAGICCISEPWSVPVDPCWFSSQNKLAAILWSPEVIKEVVTLSLSARDFVAARYRGLYLVSVYMSPNARIDRFLEMLDSLRDFLTSIQGEVIICGDFNARSSLWGDQITNRRGEILENWMAELDLRLGNVGSVPTCVRPQGTSVIDLTWSALHDGHFIANWKVSDSESLSDHKYVTFEFRERDVYVQEVNARYPRWNIKKFDDDLFSEILSIKSECFPREGDIEEMCKWLKNALMDACDLASRRYSPRPARKAAYWWNEAVAVARNECIRARRRAMRRARNLSVADREIYYRNYKSAKRVLRIEIRKAKALAWQELIDEIDINPWGLAYKIVLNRLRRPSPKLSEMVDRATLEQLLQSLFPPGETHDPTDIWGEWQGPLEDYEVRPEQIAALLRNRGQYRGRFRETAPGPDGITKKIWRKVPFAFLECLAFIFNTCLGRGIYPSAWKRAKLVFIPKEEWRGTGVPKARPICLLDEVGKIFERILVARIKDLMEESALSRLSYRQYGFREKRSTVDAIVFLKDFINNQTDKGNYVIAVSLDIKNAFNSLPWGTIRWSLERKGFPIYLRRIIDSYLHERCVECPACDGKIQVYPMTAGVPQGSVLGPFLWNIAFDFAIEMKAKPGSEIIAYADDTLVVSWGRTIEQTQSRVNDQLVPVLRRLESLGLTVAAQKTDAVLFPGRGRVPEKPVLIRINREYVRTSPFMKYLGVMLDSRLNFREHFSYVAVKAQKVSRALGRLMPNLRGPDEKKRRLYSNVLNSVILYAAPVWCGSLTTSPNNRRTIRQVQRTVALRVCSAYRTVSYDAATLLARTIPLELLAAERLRVYTRVMEARRTGENYNPSDFTSEERVLTERQWRAYLDNQHLPGARTRTAVLPSFADWMRRETGSVNFHLTQLLTGHGCFGTYLARIGKRDNPLCWHCSDGVEDSAEHTLFGCSSWDEQRLRLFNVIGPVNTLEALVRVVLTDHDYWIALSEFAGSVMRAKEEVERAVERGIALPPIANVGSR